MQHWDWQTIIAAVSLGLVLLGLAWRGWRHLISQNEEQLRESRRIKRELFGEDDDNPGGAKGPTVRAMISQVIDQTRPLVTTVEEHGRRLGKVEDAQADLSSRLTEVERVVLRQVPPL